ncbi:glutathione S-transferase family protein [Methylobacterium trifolii]|uniref:Glutathione S-transferase GST-4.5 n=1 Tax=Methylobacterium trifolii TaxID=1003092 RepID=A0ABQ4TUN7_9HYPH|nr:glutathione S-transferase family protein [Methylobacterium trifolii]GJE58326.1 Glutathione S-transferase GST-4.5 [Methylobacterium trifolii]
MTTSILYYAPGACSLASHIALEETGAPYETVRLNLQAGDQRAPEYLAVNERGRVPALVEGDWVLTENTAILRHVARAHPQASLWPADPRAQAVADEWLCWLSINHHPAFAHIRRAERYSDEEAALPGIRAKAADTYGDLCTMTEVRLSNGGWAVGDRYSVVDTYLLLFWTWGRGPALNFDMDGRFPAWSAHARAMAGRPAVRTVFAREGLALP